jgi:hypothetical protein
MQYEHGILSLIEMTVMILRAFELLSVTITSPAERELTMFPLCVPMNYCVLAPLATPSGSADIPSCPQPQERHS